MQELLEETPDTLSEYREWCGSAIAELTTLADGDTRGPMNEAVHAQAAEFVRRAKLFAVQLGLFPLAVKLPERELKTVLNAILQLERCRRYKVNRKSNNTRLTPPDVAKRYGVSPDTVRGWIERGLLRAVNISPPGSKRPRHRIEPEALAEFDRKQIPNIVPPTPERRRRKIPKLLVTKFSER